MDEDDIKDMIKEENYRDDKKALRQLLFTDIKNEENLEDIKRRVQKKWRKPLNNLEHDYIDRKFLKYCTQLWLDDVHKIVSEEIKNDKTQDILMSIDHVKKLNDVPNVFKKSHYYKMLNLHNTLVDKSGEVNLIHKFKSICLNGTQKYNAGAKKELEFIGYLASFLDANNENQDIIRSLDLKGFIEGKVPFDMFLNSIIELNTTETHSDTVLLIKSAESLQNEKQYILIKKIEELIRGFLKPAEVHKKILDDRSIIEIKSRNLKISTVLDHIESLIIKNHDILEIQFIISKNMYIDRNLNNNVWHGKNIGILTRDLYIIENVSWDVSGKNSEHKYESHVGNEKDGRGKDGSDGYAGESGGNVMILAKNIFNKDFLSIFSNGGNGSDGQKGGNGVDGADGQGINRSEFTQKFPSVIKCASPMWKRIKEVKEMIRSIKYLATTTHCEWYTDDKDPGACDAFLEITTSQGNHITFSYCRGGLFSRYQGFLLYKGSLGGPGKPGGKNGLGGEGGFPGIIEVRNLQNQQEFEIKKYLNRGTTGISGKVGNHGIHGKNSWDMGYMDYQFWGETVVYDSNENNINIEYYENSSPNRVWCPYKKKFAEMNVQKIKQTQQSYEYKERTEGQNERHHLSKANKKKNIVTSNLYNDYQIINLEESNKYKDLNTKFNEIDLLIKHAFLNYNYRQNGKESVRSNINRITNYKSNKNNEKIDRQKTILNSKYKILKAIATHIPIELKKIMETKMFMDEAPKMKKITLNLNELNIIYENWTKCKSKIKESDMSKKVEIIFVEKYRIAVLQEIAQKVNIFENKNNFCSVFATNDLTANQAARYLDSRNKKCTNINHKDLGSFRQYVFENEKVYRDNIIKICQNSYFLPTYQDMFGEVFSVYFSEITEKELNNKNVKKYLDEYNLFLSKKKCNIIEHYKIFKSELFKFRHKSIALEMLNRTIDEYTGNNLKNKIKHDSFLNILYKRFCEQFQMTYDWANCFEDKKFLDAFLNYIKHQGPQARCYRELLAHIFDINMRVYNLSDEKGFTLLDNHNRSSSNIIYFSYDKENMFSEININHEYLILNKSREYMDIFFLCILSNVYAIDNKKTLLEYLEKIDVTSYIKETNNQPNQIINEKFDEEKEIDEISNFFQISDRKEVKLSLQKIVSCFIGHSGIVRIILRRFQYEGRYVSSKEIRYLVNVILNSHLSNEKLEYTQFWIVATVSQSNWIAEFILLELESFFMKRLNKKIEFQMCLNKLNPDILVTFGIKLYNYKKINIALSSLYVEDTLYLLSNIENIDINLEDIELSEWLYVLKEYYWIYKTEKLFKWHRNDLESIPYYLLSLENKFGMMIISEFLDILAVKNIIKIQDIVVFQGILQNFVDQRWNLNIEELKQLRNVNNLLEWVKKLDNQFYISDAERNAKQLAFLIDGDSNTSPNIKQHLPQIINILHDMKDEKKIVNDKHVREMSENDIKNYVQQFRSNEEKYNIQSERLLDVINRAIELKRGFQLRDTQKLTIMSFLMNKNSTLAQVSTGEGKSLIVVAISIMKALFGEKVDIVTSSSVLAIRDAAINKDIYDLFCIGVGHNCSEIIANRKRSYSSSKVVYGDLSNFQRDYLLDRFYGENILGDHDFSNIVIDEVDSMLLDKGNNTLYLAHDIAGLDKLESVYVYIWCCVNRPVQDAKDVADVMNISKIKEAILYDMYGIIKKTDIDKLHNKLNECQKNEIWNCLVQNKIIEMNGRLLIQNISNVNFNNLSTDLLYLKKCILYMLRECIERHRSICVPKYLNKFIERHLESWIESAFAAFFMKAGHDYVVDVDRSKTISDGNPIITIIDRATGTDQIGSQWNNALHQFLQLKHGCKLTMLNLKAVFISNVSYFKLYNKVYGLTGTLGDLRERNLLKEVHGVDFVTVPTAKCKKFHEYVPIVCKNKEMWIDSIHEEVLTVVNKEVRSILIICQFVEDVELIQSKLIDKGLKNIYIYTRDYEDFDIAKGSKKLKESQVIVATNLAGRGTDIILTDTLKERGGLHVCLTYLPTNSRIESQAFGRAARCGDKGTGRLIVVDECFQGSGTSKVMNIKKERDADEIRRISLINVEYNNIIKIEEMYFDRFKTLFEKINNNLTTSEIAPEIISILLQCCLDDWTFWLDDKGSIDENYGLLRKSFQSFYDRLESLTCDLAPVSVNESFITQKCFDLIKRNPIKMVILGKYFLAQNNFDQALALFNTVIEHEEAFSEAAHYYKSYIISKQINWEHPDDANKAKRKMFKEELVKSARLFNNHAGRSLYNATMIDKIKENYLNSIIQIEAFKKQQQIYSNFYNIFVKSIDWIDGAPVTFQSFTSYDINETQAQDVFDTLVKEGILSQTKVKKNIKEFQIKPISQDFGISTQLLQKFLEKYENKYFDINVFMKDLKSCIHLPSCGMFWKILLEQGILFNEVKYVIIDKIILNQLDPSFLELLNEEENAFEDIQKVNTDLTMAHDKSNRTKAVFIRGINIKEQNNENNFIFYKNDLKALNKQKYLWLKKKGALSFNKMAYIDNSKIATAKFMLYDSISSEDFSKINICENEANEILSELSNEDIIEQREIGANQFIYQLKVQYEKIFEINLKSREVYKKNVIGLLLSCFAYRIAFEKLQKQLNEDALNIAFQLMTKPHHSLCFELVEHELLKKVKVTNKTKITEKRVKDLFGFPIYKRKFIELLQNSQIIPESKAPKLFDNLVSANWIQHSKIYGQVVLEKLSGQPLEKLYEIIKPHQNRQPLNKEFRPFQKSIEMFLNYRLGIESSVTSLTKVINELKGSTKSLSVPDSSLKPLTHFISSNKFLNEDEMNVMSLNGLDSIQVLKEKKYTTKMYLGTAMVFGSGLIQIAVGVVTLIYSVGFMTHLGSVLISEGISDMLYATSAYRSGYFCWNDYLKHKGLSLLFSTITVGVGALFSWGVQYSRFGYKLFGPALQETCGKELVKKTGLQVIYKSISTEILKGVAICAANYGTDALIERKLKNFCEDIGFAITSNIETEVDKISSRLKIIYQMYGEIEAKKAIVEITDNFFHNHNIGNNILPTAMKISSSVVKGVKEAAIKKNSSASVMLLTVNIIDKILVWSNRAKDLYMIKSITKDFVNKLCTEIDEKLMNTKDKSENFEFCQEKYYDFQKEITENWKKILREQSGRVIKQNIVLPLLEDCLYELITFSGKIIKNAYTYTTERNLESKFKELQQQFKNNIIEAKTVKNREGLETEKAITDKYYTNILNLLEQTRNPKLFANMILENIPMDSTCALASGPAIEALLYERGIVVPSTCIIFKNIEGIEQEINIGPKSKNKINAVIDLKNNHYQIAGSNNHPDSKSSENNCLFQALAAVIPELRELGPDQFRIAVARQIIENPKIQHHIENRWHKYPTRLQLYGGAKKRKRSSRRDDPDSTDHHIKKVADHIYDRFDRIPRLAGVIQRISRDTGNPREEIVIAGASEFQDRSSNLGINYHAAHVTRGVIGNCIDPHQHAEAFVELTNLLGHTQIVPRFANEYHGGIGGVIDNITGIVLQEASFIDFDSYSPNNTEILNKIKNAFVSEIGNFLDNSDRLTENNRIDIEIALNRINKTTVREMYKSGRRGFSNRKYRDAYM